MYYSTEQCGVLSKYEKLWASYQEKYESKEKFKLLTKKKEELHAVQEHREDICFSDIYIYIYI